MHPRTKETLAALEAWTQGGFGRRSQIARALGVSPSTVTSWLKGRRNLSADQLFQIEDFLARQKQSLRKSG
jgi:transcriptional regulator with XRE-family HTH domain